MYGMGLNYVLGLGLAMFVVGKKEIPRYMDIFVTLCACFMEDLI